MLCCPPSISIIFYSLVHFLPFFQLLLILHGEPYSLYYYIVNVNCQTMYILCIDMLVNKTLFLDFLSIYVNIMHMHAHIDLPVVGYMLYVFLVFLIFITPASTNNTAIRHIFLPFKVSFLKTCSENFDSDVSDRLTEAIIAIFTINDAF